MYSWTLLILILSSLDLSHSTCPVFCDRTSNNTLECHVTPNTSELEDNWIQSCHYPSSGILLLRIIVTNYSYASLPINLPSNLSSVRHIMFNFYQLQSLTLNSNSDNSNISSLSLLGGNSFTNGITDFLSKFSNLLYLYIMNNMQLDYLEDGSFVSLTELVQLTVERVGIERIGENLFDGLSVLLRLEWTSSVTSSLASSTFSRLPSLQYLNLMDNKIASIPCDLFQRLYNLKEIDLARNLLSSLPSQSFQQMPSLTLLHLESNPLVCDCNMYWLEYAESIFNLTVVWPCGGSVLSPINEVNNTMYRYVVVCSNTTNNSSVNSTQINFINSTVNATVLNNRTLPTNTSLCYNMTVLKREVNTTATCQSQYNPFPEYNFTFSYQNTSFNSTSFVNTTGSNTTSPYLVSANICPNMNFTCNSPTQPCQHLCINFLSGFSCTCDDGYILESDGYTCSSNMCPADHSYCPDSSCCIPSLYSCPLNLTDTLEEEMGVTMVQVSPLQEAVNRSILLSSIDDIVSLNISLSASSQVLVQSCEVDWQLCLTTVFNLNMTESSTFQFSLSTTDTPSSSPLRYLLLSVTEIESRAKQLYERLLVVIQSSLTPTIYTRSLVRTAVYPISSDVLIGAAVSSLEAGMCSQVCPEVNVSLFSVGLIDVDVSNWEGVSVRLVGCTSLPSQYWMSYSSYVFSIEWVNVSSELNGKYELRMNVSGLTSGVSELSIDYPVAENACEGRLEMGVYWKWTTNGTSSVIPCSQLFGQNEDSLSLYSSCDSDLNFGDITLECVPPSDRYQILVFAAEFIQSNKYFSSLVLNSSFHIDNCLSNNQSVFILEEFEVFDEYVDDNLVFYRIDVSNISIEDVQNMISRQNLFELLKNRLDICLVDYSVDLFIQSTKCECSVVRSQDRDVLNIFELCQDQACSCQGANCSCNTSNGYIGSGLNCSYDTDGDGFPDHRVMCDIEYCVDNCLFTPNPLQEDCDGDMVGDACTSYLGFESDNTTLQNRSIILEPGTRESSLNLSLFDNSTYIVRVYICEVGWIECEHNITFYNQSNSDIGKIDLSMYSDWSLNYLLISFHHYDNGSKLNSVRILVVSQNVSVPEFQSRSFVSGNRIWVGVSVSSCTSECSQLVPSLWSIGLRDVNITDMEEFFSIELEYCEFLPTVHWFGISSYIFSVTVKKRTDLLNGRYLFNVTGDNIEGISTFSLEYPGLDDACESDLELGLYWNWTGTGESLYISCFDLIGDFSSIDKVTNSFLERECDDAGNWSGISGQCPLKGNTRQVIVITCVLNPSNLYFVSQDDSSVNYSRECLGELLGQIQSVFTDLDSVYIDNLVYFRLNATHVSINDIQNKTNDTFVPLLNDRLESCIDDYSIYVLNQSTICECKPNTTEAVRERANVVKLCDELACNCTFDSSKNCRCTDEFYGDGTLCSFDTDGDGLPDYPVPCDGVTLCNDTCPYQSRCFEDQNIDESCEFVCPEERDSIFNITWPCTSVGAKRYVDCPEGTFRASRICVAAGAWAPPNTISCMSDQYANISNYSLIELQEVSNSTLSVSGDVIKTLDIIFKNSEFVLNGSAARIEAANQVANIISNLVRSENRAVLENTQIEHPVVQRVLSAVNTFANSIGTGRFKVNDSLNVFIGTYSPVPEDDNQIQKVASQIEIEDNEIQIVADNIKVGEEERSPSILIPIDRSRFNRTATFVVIKNLGSLLSNISEYLTFGTAGIGIDYFKNISVVTPIITFNITENGNSVNEVDARMSLPIDVKTSTRSYFRPLCVFIQDQNSANPQLVQEVNETTAGDNVELIGCPARRSASFLVIVGINELSNQSIVLNLISYVGCCISIVCLTLSVFIYILFGYKLLKKIYHFAHFNLALSLLLTYLVFMLGIELPYVNVLEYIPCKIVSALMQYILLAMFMWMLMEGVIIFIIINFPYRKFTKKYFFVFFCISWLSPLLYIIVISPIFHPYFISPPYFGYQEPTNISNSTSGTDSSTTVPVNPNPGFCWIHNDEDTNLIFAVTTPILLIIATNLLIYLIVSIRCIILIKQHKSVHLLAKSQKLGIRLFHLSIVLFPVLGFGWSFGLFAVISHVAVFAWLFAILGSCQGMIILFFVVLIRKDIRTSILRALNLKSKFSTLYTKITSRQTTATQLYWNLARLLEEDMLTRSTLELAKEQGLVSPTMEIEELLVYLEDKYRKQSNNLDAVGERDFEHFHNQLVPDIQPEKPGTLPVFEITQLMTFLEEHGLEEKARRTAVTEVSAPGSSMLVPDTDSLQGGFTHSRDFSYQGNDPYVADIEVPEWFKLSKADISVSENEVVSTDWHKRDEKLNDDFVAEVIRSNILQHDEEIRDSSFEFPISDVNSSLIELTKAIGIIDDTPAARTAPDQVVEQTSDEFPMSIRNDPRNIIDLQYVQESNAKQDEVKTVFDNNSLFPLIESNIPTEITSPPPAQEENGDTLDFLIDQIDDLLTDIESLNPLTRI